MTDDFNGAVMLYRESNGVWGAVNTINGIIPHNLFGYSLAWVDENVLAVGSFRGIHCILFFYFN